MNFSQFFTDPTVSAVTIGLVTVIVGTLAVNRYEAHRAKATIEITATTVGDRLGFCISAKRRTLNHPRVLFSSCFMEPLHPCEILDERGQPYKDDFLIAGGKPICILPMRAVPSWEKKNEESWYLDISVFDPPKEREVYSESHGPFRPTKLWIAVSVPREPKPVHNFEAVVQIYADGLDREEIQRFYLGLNTFVTRVEMKDPVETSWFRYELLLQKRPLLWWMR